MSNPSTPFPWKGGCPKGRGLAEDERERSQPPALRATSFQRKEGEVVKTIYSLPVEGGCPKGRGLAKGEKERSQPPALRATSFQRKEGECRPSCIVISSGSEKSFSFAVRQKL